MADKKITVKLFVGRKEAKVCNAIGITSSDELLNKGLDAKVMWDPRNLGSFGSTEGCTSEGCKGTLKQLLGKGGYIANAESTAPKEDGYKGKYKIVINVEED